MTALTSSDSVRSLAAARPEVRGKFLWQDGEKLPIRGVTYGTFEPGPDETGYPEQSVVELDFDAMAAAGFNCIRTYTPPPRRILDAAWERGLRVLVGLAWEQHVSFLSDRKLAASIVERVRSGVRACAGHPAVLGYAVGNEIPSTIVRWHGRLRVERFLERLHKAVKDEDPNALVTYVNYPSTEYLELPFIDFVCFNVFLESPERLRAYLARLQNIAGDRPLVLTEIGLDSRRHGEEGQAASLEWQVRTTLAAGCAGAFVFSWTDDWYRGGYAIEDWDFGLTDRERRPKPALFAVSNVFEEGPFPPDDECPRVSVVICTYNGTRTLEETLQAVAELDYPDYEVIVVDDGSTDGSAELAEQFWVNVIRTENHGLSSARNTGLAAATGEIVAYLDDDARPDPHWLRHLALSFVRSGHSAVGGPNIPPLDDGPVAECVAHAPGGPIQVLLSDEEAEHIPGCNMAVRAHDLRAIGGFDTVFRAAGDDVDVCWRLQESGLTIGFNPAAVVWHRRRNAVAAYLRQQRGYGRAEALLERKWPQKYNGFGHVSWGGRLYGSVARHPLGRRPRINYGKWGTGLFQRIYHPPPTSLHSLPLMPEWPLFVAALAGIAALGSLWDPFAFAGIPAALLTLFVLVEAAVSAVRAPLRSRGRSRVRRIAQRLLLMCLYVLQPIARLGGRLSYGLTPWRMRGRKKFALPRPRSAEVWSEHWVSAEDRLEILEEGVRGDGTAIVPGQAFDRWDLEACGGMLGAARLRMAIEEHGSGRQLVRFRIRPRLTRVATCLVVAVGGVATVAALYGAWKGAVVLAAVCAALALRALLEAAMSTAALLRGVQRQHDLAEHELRAELQRRLVVSSRKKVATRV
ncbi:MAG TPA: glycosyltransferase [Gaiellaceae bacterium]|nr:glycosyltransferase [Gaiellaceae bacterium]